MKHAVLATMTLSMLAFAAPPGSASIRNPQVWYATPPGGVTFRGGCGFVVMRDDTGQFGSEDNFIGVVYLAVSPNNSGAATVSCELKKNGATLGGRVLGPTSGTGVVADAGQLQFVAVDSDVMTLCTHVTVTSPETVCVDGTTRNLVNGPVYDALGSADPLLCLLFVALAPTVDSIAPTLVYIDPTQGDVHLLGASRRFFDCPPYGA